MQSNFNTGMIQYWHANAISNYLFEDHVYIIYIDEALFCHVLTLVMFCFYLYSHFENQLGISATRLGQCL